MIMNALYLCASDCYIHYYIDNMQIGMFMPWLKKKLLSGVGNCYYSLIRPGVLAIDITTVCNLTIADSDKTYREVEDSLPLFYPRI